MNLQQLKEKGGKGFKIKGSDKLALIQCPECHAENYAMNVTAGICSWCGFDVNARENK